MPDKMYDVNIRVSISIPIIGDKSISKINPPDDFEYKLVKLDEYEYKNKMIDGNGDVSIEFIGAVHFQGTERFILILHCEKEIVCQSKYPTNSLGAMVNDKLNPIFNSIKDCYEKKLLKYFSLIHLYKEGDVARKYSFYRFSAQSRTCIVNSRTNSICADMITSNLNPMTISDEEIENVNRCLACNETAYSILKNNALNGLEYTYHILDSTTNYINVISVLEILFIKRKERRHKAENLSQRIAVFLGKDDNEINKIYKEVKNMYTIRSEAIHNGKDISSKSLDELRVILRKCIKRYIVFIEEKQKCKCTMQFGDLRGHLIIKLQKRLKNIKFK